jgi:hypothetical protein
MLIFLYDRDIFIVQATKITSATLELTFTYTSVFYVVYVCVGSLSFVKHFDSSLIFDSNIEQSPHPLNERAHSIGTGWKCLKSEKHPSLCCYFHEIYEC